MREFLHYTFDGKFLVAQNLCAVPQIGNLKTGICELHPERNNFEVGICDHYHNNEEAEYCWPNSLL